MAFLYSSLAAQVEVSDGFSQLAGNKGGRLEFKRIFRQEVIYPEKSLKEKIKGNVVFKFIVMKDGTIRDIRKTDSVNTEIDNEALRILKLMEWHPSIYRSDSVNSFLDIKFSFNPAKYNRIVKERGYEKMPYPEGYMGDKTMKVYEQVDQQAVYVNGNYALAEFIQKNIDYPQVARVQKIKGTVLLSFVVEPSGFPTNIHIIKSLGFGCDEEAVRVLSLVKWIPATKNGMPVRARMSFPVIFNLNEEFKDNSHGEQKY